MKKLLFLLLGTWTLLGDDVRVLVWDERQPAQKQAYPHFLGNTLASHLNSLPGISALATSLDAPDKGISEGRLDAADVLIWWGHVRQAEITPEDCRPIIERIKAGRLGFIALHSAHWATPFMEAMNERTRMDAAKKFSPSPSTPKVAFEWVAPPGRISPSWASLVTPAYLAYQRAWSGHRRTGGSPELLFSSLAQRWETQPDVDGGSGPSHCGGSTQTVDPTSHRNVC